MATSEQEKKFAIWKIIVKCVEQVESEDYPGGEVIRFVYHQLGTSRAAALEPKPSDPGELHELNNRIDRLKHRHVTQGVQIREQIARLREQVARLEAWSEKFASWSDEEHLVKSPRL